MKKEKDGTDVSLELNAGSNKAEKFRSSIYLRYHKYIDTYDGLTKDELSKLPKSMKVAEKATAIFDLTKNEGEKVATEHLRTPLSFAYTLKTGSTINMDLILSGRRSNPKIEIKPKIDYKNNETKKNVSIRVGFINEEKRNTTSRIGEFLYEGKVKSYDDKPNRNDTNKTDHLIQYIIRLNRSDGSFILTQEIYNQKDIGLSTAEKVLIGLSAGFFALTILFIWLGVKNVKLIKKGDHIENEVKSGKIDRLLEG